MDKVYDDTPSFSLLGQPYADGRSRLAAAVILGGMTLVALAWTVVVFVRAEQATSNPVISNTIDTAPAIFPAWMVCIPVTWFQWGYFLNPNTADCRIDWDPTNPEDRGRSCPVHYLEFSDNRCHVYNWKVGNSSTEYISQLDVQGKLQPYWRVGVAFPDATYNSLSLVYPQTHKVQFGMFSRQEYSTIQESDLSDILTQELPIDSSLHISFFTERYDHGVFPDGGVPHYAYPSARPYTSVPTTNEVLYADSNGDIALRERFVSGHMEMTSLYTHVKGKLTRYTYYEAVASIISVLGLLSTVFVLLFCDETDRYRRLWFQTGQSSDVAVSAVPGRALRATGQVGDDGAGDDTVASDIDSVDTNDSNTLVSVHSSTSQATCTSSRMDNSSGSESGSESTVASGTDATSTSATATDSETTSITSICTATSNPMTWDTTETATVSFPRRSPGSGRHTKESPQWGRRGHSLILHWRQTFISRATQRHALIVFTVLVLIVIAYSVSAVLQYRYSRDHPHVTTQQLPVMSLPMEQVRVCAVASLVQLQGLQCQACRTDGSTGVSTCNGTCDISVEDLPGGVRCLVFTPTSGVTTYRGLGDELRMAFSHTFTSTQVTNSRLYHVYDACHLQRSTSTGQVDSCDFVRGELSTDGTAHIHFASLDRHGRGQRVGRIHALNTAPRITSSGRLSTESQLSPTPEYTTLTTRVLSLTDASRDDAYSYPALHGVATVLGGIVLARGIFWAMLRDSTRNRQRFIFFHR